ncbi:MAG: hypothetical protein ACK5XN_36555 [Bacteroidota bacterium]
MKQSMQHKASNGFKSFLFLMAASLLMNCSKAQMSPFDGSYTIVLHVINSPSESIRFELKEKNQPVDSCSFSPQRSHLVFQNPESVLIRNRYNNYSWEIDASKYAKDAAFMSAGYYAVVLSSSERSCMIRKGNEYIYLNRIFQIVSIQNNIETVVAEVPQEKVYDLSKMRGRWDQIRSIPITYP